MAGFGLENRKKSHGDRSGEYVCDLWHKSICKQKIYEIVFSGLKQNLIPALYSIAYLRHKHKTSVINYMKLGAFEE